MQGLHERAAAIDREALDSIRQIDPQGANGVLEMLIRNFFESTPKHIETLRQGVSSCDADAIRDAAHSLKSNSAFVGAMALASLCEGLEAIADRGAFERVAEMVSRIEPEYEEVKVALEAERGTAGALAS